MFNIRDTESTLIQYSLRAIRKIKSDETKKKQVQNSVKYTERMGSK